MHYRIYALAALACVGYATHSSAAPTPPNLPGNWQLSFAEEFNAPLDSKLWKQSIWGLTSFPTEAEIYDPSAVSVSNGVLSLTARQESLGGKNYVSGLINTGPVLGQSATGYSFRYGYAEARIKLVSGQGLWPAFWMLPDPNPAGTYHDGDGEIDIMEALGQQPTVDQVHLHQFGSQWGSAVDAGVDLSKDFHNYGVNWTAGKLDFYLDGQLIDTINASPSVAEYLILNMAVGSNLSWPGAPDSTTPFPSSMQVDYVHVWQQGAGSFAPVPEPTCLGLLGVGAMGLLSRRRKALTGA